MNTNFFLLIENLKNRRNMYVFPNGYYSLTNFIAGYDFGIKEFTAVSMLEEFRKWLQRKVKHEFSTDAFTYIHHYMTDSKESEAEQLLFQLFKEFEEEISKI